MFPLDKNNPILLLRQETVSFCGKTQPNKVPYEKPKKKIRKMKLRKIGVNNKHKAKCTLLWRPVV